MLGASTKEKMELALQNHLKQHTFLRTFPSKYIYIETIYMCIYILYTHICIYVMYILYICIYLYIYKIMGKQSHSLMQTEVLFLFQS